MGVSHERFREDRFPVELVPLKRFQFEGVYCSVYYPMKTLFQNIFKCHLCCRVYSIRKVSTETYVKNFYKDSYKLIGMNCKIKFHMMGKM